MIYIPTYWSQKNFNITVFTAYYTLFLFLSLHTVSKTELAFTVKVCKFLTRFGRSQFSQIEDSKNCHSFCTVETIAENGDIPPDSLFSDY